jgi:hypothetical protein
MGIVCFMLVAQLMITYHFTGEGLDEVMVGVQFHDTYSTCSLIASLVFESIPRLVE